MPRRCPLSRQLLAIVHEGDYVVKPENGSMESFTIHFGFKDLIRSLSNA